MKLGFVAGLVFVHGAAIAETPGSATDDSTPTAAVSAGESRDVRREVPLVAYTYSARGVSTRTIGVQAYGLGVAARGQDAVLGGGGAVWGSPVERLTLIADGQRNLSRNFSPSAAAIVRIVGDGREGFTLGALGKFKIDGFSAGPSRDEVESELEVGALLAYASAGWYLDFNAIAGRGLGDDGETDTEGRLRLGRDLGSWLRLGFDGQGRVRVSGDARLPNGRTWDFAAGAQALAYNGNFFGSFTAGPSTTGLLTTNVGWSAIVAFGGTTF